MGQVIGSGEQTAEIFMMSPMFVCGLYDLSNPGMSLN